MKPTLSAALSRAGLPAPLGPGLVLGLFAYRPLFLGAFALPARAEMERWFFAPEQASPLLALGVAGWLLWRRRAALVSLPERSAPGAALPLLAVGVGLFLWAQLSYAADLLLPSLAANLLAFAAASRGGAGCRAVLLPALVLLLGVPLPAPLRNEIVWQLQNGTAHGAAWLMQTTGVDVDRSGLVLGRGEYTFTVIESCSGLRGIGILTLVSVAVRELFAASGTRQWLPVLLAPPLGLALNILRVVVVVLAASAARPEAAGPEGWDHTPQGVAVLLAGTALLYALGRSMAAPGGRPDGGGSRERPRPAAPGAGADPQPPQLRWGVAAAGLAALAGLSLGVTPFRVMQQLPPQIAIPEQRAGWSGEDLALDDGFLGPLLHGYALHRRYERPLRNGPPQVVELFVGFSVAGHRGSSQLFSPKLAAPGADWSIGESRQARAWTLGLDADLGVASRDSALALVYSWRLRDEGFWRETLRALLQLDTGPFRREPPRAVVRLTTPLVADGPVARDRAKRLLDRFITDFREELAGL